MPPSPTVRTVIIGAGAGGLAMARELRRSGDDDFCIFERSDAIGGVWRDNTYPGAACDVPSHLYSFSWDAPRWRQRYATQPEILANLNALCNREGLEPFLRLGTGVERLSYSEALQRWHLELTTGETTTAQVVISAVGQLREPFLPRICGSELFEGESWHSSSWPSGKISLEERDIAVIGTGASAIQLVPEIARKAHSVTVFQRTAPYVLPKAPPWSQLQQLLFDHLSFTSKVDRLLLFLRGEVLTAGYLRSHSLSKRVALTCRSYLEQAIPSPELRAKCTPNYEVGCKRILFSSNWYPTLLRPNVTLVANEAVRLDADGVFDADGQHHPATVVIYATGFQGQSFLQPMEVIGQNGQTLREAWSPYPKAYFGLAVAGFPNFFMIYGPNTNLGANSVLYMEETQVRYIAAAIRYLHASHFSSLNLRRDQERSFERWIARRSKFTSYTSGCRSWYVDTQGRNINNWPSFTWNYRRKLGQFQSSDYELR
ncbi:MAG: flavin-containing monooxygenase [Acidimicrobiales bacterium]